jgi:hypothetical protein
MELAMSRSRRTAHRSEHLFVIRMWQEPAGAETSEAPAAPSPDRSDWRGTVQHILSGERVYFVQFPDLNAFIRSQLARPASRDWRSPGR